MFYESRFDRFMASAAVPAFLGILLISLLLMVFTVLFDGVVLDRVTFNKQIACEAKREVPKRPFLSTNVVCVPALARQDTLTLNKGN